MKGQQRRDTSIVQTLTVALAEWSPLPLQCVGQQTAAAQVRGVL
jgi:hypothetical protein